MSFRISISMLASRGNVRHQKCTPLEEEPDGGIYYTLEPFSSTPSVTQLEECTAVIADH